MHTLEAGKKFKAITGITPKIDITTSMLKNGPVMDLFDLDIQLEDNDPDYNSLNCTYKGQPDYSMSKYIKEKWGEQALMYCQIMCGLNLKPEIDAIQPN